MPQDDLSNLFHLIGFCLAASWLDVQDFRNIGTVEDMMAALVTLLKPKSAQKVAYLHEPDVGARGPAEDPFECLFRLAIPTCNPEVDVTSNAVINIILVFPRSARREV